MTDKMYAMLETLARLDSRLRRLQAGRTSDPALIALLLTAKETLRNRLQRLPSPMATA
ncbi:MULTISPECIES: hypothetical protein [Novosphingobium]|uniref:DUF465 domain-containing protein n=3 Tax=Pseudomonadota TaxID=1224 RepID=A0ABT0AI69_9SPHN|nr:MULTISPECIES: hypothetical protein [Novosphingobium]MCJ1962889.1 hypothetical protein [Novosphingobium mangrovi (ex Hu et al. 2023)]QVM83503.1 hypothetical protein HT578_07190 [Novosphingobium decolorationis]